MSTAVDTPPAQQNPGEQQDPKELSASEAFREAATHWAFVYPSGWSIVQLDDVARIDDRVRGIVLGRLGRRDDRAKARREAREHLSQAAHGAAESGGLTLGVFSMEVADIALTGTMAVFPYAVASDADQDELVAGLAGSMNGADVARQNLEDGWVLRAVRQSEIERTDEEGNPVLPELRADYWTERRGLGKVLQISFTTPFVPLREAMVELFDAVVLSLHPVVRG